MELRQLQMFQATAEEGSITGAARRMNLTQPALSRQIKALEEELGVELFARGAHSVSLTPAGAVLRDEAAKLLRFCDAMVEKVRVEASGEPLRVAYAPSLSRGFISIAIERFTQLHARVRVGLFDRSSAEMRVGLEAGEFDVILTVPSGSESVRWIPLREYGWRLLMPAAHPYASKDGIRSTDLDGVKLVMFGRDAYPEYWEGVTRFFRERGLQAKVAGEVDGASSLEAAVEAGLGLALIGETPCAVDAAGNGRLVSRALIEEPRRIVVAAGVPAGKECPAKLLAFIEELKRAAGES